MHSLFALPALSSTLSHQPPSFGFPSFSFGPSAPAPCQHTRALSDSQPRSLAPPPLPTLPPAFPLAPPMTSRILTGPAAMPRATKTPNFDGATGEPIIEFLTDYNEIADTHYLTDQQKVEYILKYIPPSQKDLWRSLKGYTTGDWTTFSKELEKLYPDIDAATRYSKQALYKLVNMSARTRMRDEKDVFDYYRRFLAISNPLHSSGQISSDERNSEFFRGFHSFDRSSMANRLYPLHLNCPRNKPYDLKDVFAVAQGYFADLQFYRPDDSPSYPPPANPNRWPHPPPEEDRTTRWYDREPTYHQRDCDFPCEQRDRPRDISSQREHNFLRDFNPTHDPPRDHHNQYSPQTDPPKPEFETRTVRFADQNLTKANARDNIDLEDMVLKMHNLSVREPAYAALYAQICHHYPNAAKPLLLPDFGQTAAVAYQSPASQPASTSSLQL
jgi:hypothetical protein